jgi:hypothetical protein
LESVADALDAMHAAAKDAFERRDFAAYRELFAPGLTYRRADGGVVGRDELIRDAMMQSRCYRRMRSAIVREALEVEGDRAVEVATRTVRVGVTAFLVVHRCFEYVVRGRYTWRKADGRWRIEAIEVLEQRIALGRSSFGLRAPDLSTPEPER